MLLQPGSNTAVIHGAMVEHHLGLFPPVRKNINVVGVNIALFHVASLACTFMPVSVQTHIMHGLTAIAPRALPEFLDGLNRQRSGVIKFSCFDIIARFSNMLAIVVRFARSFVKLR